MLLQEGMGGMPSQQQVQEQQAKVQAAEEQRKELLQKVLTPEANDRLARIALVKPDKVRACASDCVSRLRFGMRHRSRGLSFAPPHHLQVARTRRRRVRAHRRGREPRHLHRRDALHVALGVEHPSEGGERRGRLQDGAASGEAEDVGDARAAERSLHLRAPLLRPAARRTAPEEADDQRRRADGRVRARRGGVVAWRRRGGVAAWRRGGGVAAWRPAEDAVHRRSKQRGAVKEERW